MGNKRRTPDVTGGPGNQNESLAGVITTCQSTISKKLETNKIDLHAEDNGAPKSSVPVSLNRMEKRKKRRAFDKERHRPNSQETLPEKPESIVDTFDANEASLSTSHNSAKLHIHHFSDLSSVNASVRELAAEALVVELQEIQKSYEKQRKSLTGGTMKLEADQDDGLNICHPDLGYALRRLIRGISSSRAYSRQGFALALTAILATIPCAKVEVLMKLIVQHIEVSSSMKGQEKRESLLGRLFAYGALSCSGRIANEWNNDNSSSCIKDFSNTVLSLAAKKRYLREPAVEIMLNLFEQLPVEAILSHVLEASTLLGWFEDARDTGNPEALLLALKIREKISMDSEKLSKLLPHPFSANRFFAATHLSSLLPCFKESIFTQPRVHMLWHVVVNTLLPDSSRQEYSLGSGSVKKHKKSRKSSSSEEEMLKNLCSFCEVVVEGYLLSSSHDQKRLAFDIILLLLPKLTVSCVPIILSRKLIHCLMDVLSASGSWLYITAQYFLKELTVWIGEDEDRRVAVVVCLQKHSCATFDSVTRTHTVRDLVAGFKTSSGCMVFVQKLMNMFVDVGHVSDEPSDQSQTTDENSERGTPECMYFTALSGNPDSFRNWVIDTLPSILKNSCIDVETRVRAEKEIMKFLAVQGLFSSSLGTEITSVELKEKFTWPKAAISKALCSKCIEKLELLLADAQKRNGAGNVSIGFESNDLGSYFMHFLRTLCSIPSVAFFRQLSSKDEKAFKSLQAMESRLTREEKDSGPGTEARRIHAMRYLLIQLILHLLLCPGDVSEAALELVICCKKAFFPSSFFDASGEDEVFDNENSELMDVVVDTLLSLLPQSSGPLRSAIEQVFCCFCHDLTNAGLMRMLRVIKRELHPSRNPTVSDNEVDTDMDDDDDDDLLEIEEAQILQGEDAAVDTGDSDGHAEENLESIMQASQSCHSNSDDESGGEMDDDAMFRMDSYLAHVFKERKSLGGNESAHSQLVVFKFRILSLLEIYLQRNPGKPQVMTVFSYLARAFVNSCTVEDSEQLRQRIGGILQRKLFKMKPYPKGDEIQLSSLESLLERSLKFASRTRHKLVSVFSQNSVFWLLKILDAKNVSEAKLQRVLEILQHALGDYFNNKGSRLNAGFVREIFQRHPMLGQQLFGFLLENCRTSRSEYRRIDALDLVQKVWRSCVGKGNRESNLEFLKLNLPLLGNLINDLLVNLPEKQSRRGEVRKFCCRSWQTVQMLGLTDTFIRGLKPEAIVASESCLGDAFLKWRTQ